MNPQKGKHELAIRDIEQYVYDTLRGLPIEYVGLKNIGNAVAEKMSFVSHVINGILASHGIDITPVDKLEENKELPDDSR